MGKYTINKEIDLSDEFEELSVEKQKEFLKYEFDEFPEEDQKEMLNDIFLEILSSEASSDVLCKAFENLNEQGQSKVYAYINDIMDD